MDDISYDALKHALDVLGPITSKELAQQLELPIQKVSQKLRYLYITSQIFRKEILVEKVRLFLWRTRKSQKSSRSLQRTPPKRTSKAVVTQSKKIRLSASKPKMTLEKGVTLEDVQWLEDHRRGRIRERRLEYERSIL